MTYDLASEAHGSMAVANREISSSGILLELSIATTSLVLLTNENLCRTVHYKGEFVWAMTLLGPSQVSTLQCIVFVHKFMDMAFWTKQSIQIIVNGHISGVSARQGSTVHR